MFMSLGLLSEYNLYRYTGSLCGSPGYAYALGLRSLKMNERPYILSCLVMEYRDFSEWK